tara:strand:+ start:116 stop:457 length:342 start_codon:yes stop_codon:yes gene_type:complete
MSLTQAEIEHDHAIMEHCGYIRAMNENNGWSWKEIVTYSMKVVEEGGELLAHHIVEGLSFHAPDDDALRIAHCTISATAQILDSIKNDPSLKLLPLESWVPVKNGSPAPNEGE